MEILQPPIEWAREKQITARFGLSHMILFKLRKAGRIRTVSLQEQGKKYGARLYNVASIESYLAEQEAREAGPDTAVPDDRENEATADAKEKGGRQ